MLQNIAHQRYIFKTDIDLTIVDDLQVLAHYLRQKCDVWSEIEAAETSIGSKM